LIEIGFKNKLSHSQDFQLQNTRIISYFSVAPHMKDKVSMVEFMPLDSDKHNKKERVEHEWSKLSEEELAKKFGD
tara:strand:+ start:675 stop:899 length:225 start_codon:yes stop_codon:yes gene_type:complete